MARAEMLCAKQIVVVLFCFGRHTGRMDRHREREERERREKTDLALTETTLSPTFLFSLTNIGP